MADWQNSVNQCSFSIPSETNQKVRGLWWF